MTDELMKAQILDQYVDDLHNGVVPTLYELLATGDEGMAELLPLLDMAAWFMGSDTQMPVGEKQRIKTKVLEIARSSPDAQQWSLRRLVEESDPQAVAKSARFGLTPAELDAVSSDTTLFRLEDPNEVVAELARKYRVQFYGLMRWVRQLISDVLNSQAGSSVVMVYTRDDDARKEDRDSE